MTRLHLSLHPGLLVGAALGALCLAGCASRKALPYKYSPEEVPAVLSEARAELEAPTGDPDAEELVDRLRSARGVPDLDPGLRLEAQQSLELAAQRLIEETDEPGALRDLMELDLPRRLSVEAGVRAASLYYAEGERMKAFRLVREIDGKFPQHHMRGEAGALLAEVGFDLAADFGRYGFFFRYRSLAIQVLEYLVMEYPSEPAGDRALVTLSEIYEGRSNFELAIQKRQDLLLWFPESPLARPSEAAIPRLRLAALGSPEHDRRALMLAREELDAWLASHGAANDAELETQVERDRLDCLRRLADNDLVVARFYRTVDNRRGAKYHARRALQEAREGRDAGQIAEAEALLRDVAGGAPREDSGGERSSGERSAEGGEG